MEVIFRDVNMEELYILDSFKSLIWIDRYWKAGDISIVTAPTNKTLEFLDDTVYFTIAESNRVMILETIGIETDHVKSDALILKGRSFSSILDRRICWEPFSWLQTDGDVQAFFSSLLDDNVITPVDSTRTLSDITMVTNSDTSLDSMLPNVQFFGEDLYKIFTDVAQSFGIGFRVYYEAGTNPWKVWIYNGKDRSYSQSVNQTVAFTSKLNNLISADYVQSTEKEKSVALVTGESGVGNVRTNIEVDSPTGAGTDHSRREMFVEANINRNTPDGQLTEQEYLDQLTGRGLEQLAKKPFLTAFDGEVDTTMYNYGDEFDMGDILQIADNYGHETRSRVIEMVYSQNEEGIKMYPVFETVE